MSDTSLPWWEAAAAADARAQAEMDAAKPPVARAEKAPAPAAKPDAASSSIDDEIDQEGRTRAAELRRLGFDDAAIERHVGRAGAPSATLADVEKELAELAALRKTDQRKYLSTETQARELALIQLKQHIKAGKAPSVSAAEAIATKEEAEPKAAEARLAAIDAELAELQDQRRNAKGGERDRLDAKERTLLQEATVVEVGGLLGADVAGDMTEYLSAHGGVGAGIKSLAGLVNGAGAGIETWQAFDAMSPKVRTTVMQHALAHNGSLSRLDASIEKALSGSGSDLAAYKAWRDAHGEVIKAGLVR
jgi:hypothetical protein